MIRGARPTTLSRHELIMERDPRLFRAANDSWIAVISTKFGRSVDLSTTLGRLHGLSMQAEALGEHVQIRPMQSQFTRHCGPFSVMTLERFPNHPPLEFFDLLAERNGRTNVPG
jgi:hypothetical protein